MARQTAHFEVIVPVGRDERPSVVAIHLSEMQRKFTEMLQAFGYDPDDDSGVSANIEAS